MIKTLLKTTAVVLLLTSCVNSIKDTTDDNLNKMPIYLATRVLQAQSNTRMTGLQFEESDSIGLFVLNGSDQLTQDRYIDNVPYSFNGLSFSSEEQFFYPANQQSCRFISYYPYSHIGPEIGNSVIPIQVMANQKSNQNYGLSDFLVAKVESVKPSSNAVLLDFKHRFSKINFYIKAIDNNDLEELIGNANIYVRNLLCDADYDLESDVILNLRTAKKIAANGLWKLDSNSLQLIGQHLIVIPQECVNGQIVLEIGDRTFITNFPDLNLQSGVSFNITLNYDSKVGVNGITHKRSSWEDDDTLYESDLEEDFGNDRIAVNALDFGVSSIYNICNADGKVMGKACKEYLLNNKIDAVALVYYPESTPLEGVVLNIIGEANDIHGGLIVWSEDKNTFTYLAGESTPKNYLYVDENGAFIDESTEKSININSHPYLLSDKRVLESNSYPTVKIGKHIWTRENLRATYYNDGLRIQNNSSNLNIVTEGYYKKNNEIYYNKAAVLTGTIAPTGWSIPNEEEWQMLIDYVNDSSSKLKAGSGWMTVADIDSPNNITGFTGLPVGGYYSANTPTSMVNENYFGIYWRMNNDGINLADLAVVLNAGKNEFKGMRSYDPCAYSIRLIKK